MKQIIKLKEMEIKRSVVYTKEEMINLIIGNMADAGYSVNAKDVKFAQKRGRSSDFHHLEIKNATELPKPEKSTKKEKKETKDKKED